MKKSGQIFMWVLIGAIIILIIYVVYITTKKPPVPPAKDNLFAPGATGAPGAPVVIPPSKTVSAETFSINDKIYAGSDLTNVYTSCNATFANLDNTYKKGDLIGTFLRREGLCIVVAVKTYPFGYSWIPIEGSKDVYLTTNALIYKQ